MASTVELVATTLLISDGPAGRVVARVGLVGAGEVGTGAVGAGLVVAGTLVRPSSRAHRRVGDERPRPLNLTPKSLQATHPAAASGVGRRIGAFTQFMDACPVAGDPCGGAAATTAG
jgi:hypothetical protein